MVRCFSSSIEAKPRREVWSSVMLCRPVSVLTELPHRRGYDKMKMDEAAVGSLTDDRSHKNPARIAQLKLYVLEGEQ
jgi:hypothetical protein